MIITRRLLNIMLHSYTLFNYLHQCRHSPVKWGAIFNRRKSGDNTIALTTYLRQIYLWTESAPF